MEADEKVEAIFPKRVNKKEDMEESKLSDIVYNTILDKKCVDIYDRVNLNIEMKKLKIE